MTYRVIAVGASNKEAIDRLADRLDVTSRWVRSFDEIPTDPHAVILDLDFWCGYGLNSWQELVGAVQDPHVPIFILTQAQLTADCLRLYDRGWLRQTFPPKVFLVSTSDQDYDVGAMILERLWELIPLEYLSPVLSLRT